MAQERLAGRGEAVDGARGEDRRRYRRVQATALTSPIGVLSMGRSRTLQDVSLGGLRMFSDDRHVPGERLAFELLLPFGGSVRFIGEVVWVDALPAGAPARFDIGLRYVDVDPAALARIATVLGPEGE